MAGQGPGGNGEDTSPPTPPTGTAQEVLDLLAEGVPMALIADLIDPAGPPSPVYLEEEGAPAEAWWEPDFRPEGADGESEAVADDGGPRDRDQ